MERTSEEERFRAIFRRVHAGHAGCRDDEWLMAPCRDAGGREAPRSIVWSRRNGPWRRTAVLWVGAAPGNAGGRGSGTLGAHGTRIPFGGDIAGANLDLLLASIGLDRNRTFLVAALNQLPDRGGGEPTAAELSRPVGDYATSAHVLRDTLVASGPRMVVALGNIALRITVGAARLDGPGPTPAPPRPALAGTGRLKRAGLERGRAAPWPDAFPSDASFQAAWRAAWGDSPLPRLLWLLHPSAQNMSPYAGPDTPFHRRMIETRDALRRAAANVLGKVAAAAPPNGTGIYALPEWKERVGPRHEELVRLWEAKGV